MLAKFLIFLLTIPLLAAVAHDGYLFYEDQTLAEEKKGFQFATIGYTWNRYDKQSLREFMRPLDQEKREMAATMLGQYNVVVTGALAAFGFVLYALGWVFGGSVNKPHNFHTQRKQDRLSRVVDRKKGRS